MTQGMVATLGLAIAGQVVYQLAQKSVPPDASPLGVLTLAYFGAGALCLVLALLFGRIGFGLNLRSALGWPTWLIALAIVAIEVGYLMAYRSGWTLGTGFATSSTATVCALALLGWLAAGHTLSAKQLVGLAFSCLGVWLLLGVKQTA